MGAVPDQRYRRVFGKIASPLHGDVKIAVAVLDGLRVGCKRSVVPEWPCADQSRCLCKPAGDFQQHREAKKRYCV